MSTAKATTGTGFEWLSKRMAERESRFRREMAEREGQFAASGAEREDRLTRKMKIMTLSAVGAATALISALIALMAILGPSLR